MNEELLLKTLQKLVDSGALEKMTEPGAQAAFIYALLILLAGMVLKYIVFNGMIKRFFDLEELKIKELQTLNKKVIDIEGEIREDHRALKDIFGLLYAQRESDKR